MYGSKNGDKRKYYELSYEEALTEYYRFWSSENWEKSNKVLRISLWLDNAMFGNLHIFVIDFDKIGGTVETESAFFKAAKELADKVTRSQGGGYHMFYGIDKKRQSRFLTVSICWQVRTLRVLFVRPALSHGTGQTKSIYFVIQDTLFTNGSRGTIPLA